VFTLGPTVEVFTLVLYNVFVVGMELMEPSWVQIGLEEYNPTRLEYQVVDYHKNARKHLFELRVLDFIVCHSITTNG
jgi:hypothetical protein